MGAICTEVEFTLPVGYRDDDGTLHKHGIMRLATAADEIHPLKDHRVQSNPEYLTVIVLSRVVTKLGTVEVISTKVIEDLFIADFTHLQNLYNEINSIAEDRGASTASAEPAMQLQTLGNVEALSPRKSYTLK